MMVNVRRRQGEACGGIVPQVTGYSDERNHVIKRNFKIECSNVIHLKTGELWVYSSKNE